MKECLTYLLWLSDRPDRLAELDSELDKMTLGRRLRIASPVMAYKLVKVVEDAAAAEQKSLELGNTPDVNDVGAALADRREDEEPTATDGQLLAAFRKKFVNQMALLFIEADQARALDLADAITSEIAAARRDARELARKAGSAPRPTAPNQRLENAARHEQGRSFDRLGNPFRLEDYGREEAIRKFECEHVPTLPLDLLTGAAIWRAGAGRNWPVCHADVLLKHANAFNPARAAGLGCMGRRGCQGRRRRIVFGCRWSLLSN